MQFRDYLLGDTGGEKIWSVVVRNHIGINVLKSTSHLKGKIYGMYLLGSRTARFPTSTQTQALRNLGYTYLYTSSPEHTVQLYQMFPDLVQAVFVDEDESERCFRDIENCSLSSENPAGIPPWKIFSFAFWAHPANPLGAHWTLAPENYELLGNGHNTYLGYSIEQACRSQPFIPHAQRENQAYILAKLLSFFTPERDRAWTPAIFDAATDATGIKYVLGAINDTLKGEWPAPQLPTNYVDYGLIDQPTFLDKLSKTRVLIGMGNPMTCDPYHSNRRQIFDLLAFRSPTPYDALCLGVPFINPILDVRYLILEVTASPKG